jgi:hypothetical protein
MVFVRRESLGESLTSDIIDIIYIPYNLLVVKGLELVPDDSLGCREANGVICSHVPQRLVAVDPVLRVRVNHGHVPPIKVTVNNRRGIIFSLYRMYVHT